MPTIKRNHTGKVDTGARAYKPYVMSAIDRGALPEDVRAERAGLITPITKRAKGDIKPIVKRDGSGWKQAQAEREAAKEEAMLVQRLARMLMRGEITEEELDALCDETEE